MVTLITEAIEENKVVGKISIIIPVFNEAKLINPLLSHLLSTIEETESEIIISDGHKDSTTINSIEKKFLCLNKLKTIKAPLNRGNQMNAAAKNADGDIFLFLHADTCLSEKAFKSIRIIMKEHCAGAFRIRLDSKKLQYRVIEKLINLRTKLTNTPYGDQALFIRKDSFFSLNGFFPHPIMEDIDLIRRLRNRGEKIYISDHEVMTSCRRWEREGVVKCTLRNWYLLLMYYLGKHPDSLIKYYHY